MGETFAVEVVEKQLEYYNNHDIDGFMSTYSAGIELYNQGESTPFLTGHDALRERYTQRFSNPELHAEIVNRMVQGNFVIDHEQVTGIEKDRLINAIAIYEVKDHLIQKVWFARE